MKTVACIVVQTTKVFSWLGHMPVMNWAYTQLQDVRGIDRIVCVAGKRYAVQARKLFEADSIETVDIPGSVKTDVDLRKWLCAANGPAAIASVALTVVPTSPFLPAAKIEACLEAVKDGAPYCMPARSCNVLMQDGISRETLPELLPGVRAFRVKAKHELSSFRTVEVDMIESLDVMTPSNYQLAQALVANGSM